MSPGRERVQPDAKPLIKLCVTAMTVASGSGSAKVKKDTLRALGGEALDKVASTIKERARQLDQQGRLL